MMVQIHLEAASFDETIKEKNNVTIILKSTASTNFITCPISPIGRGTGFKLLSVSVRIRYGVARIMDMDGRKPAKR